MDWYDKKVLDCISAGGANKRMDWEFLDSGGVVTWNSVPAASLTVRMAVEAKFVLQEEARLDRAGTKRIDELFVRHLPVRSLAGYQTECRRKPSERGLSICRSINGSGGVINVQLRAILE